MPVDTGFYEAWFDGSSRPDSQRSGVGGYILTPNRELLAEYSLSIPYVECPLMLEYNAVIHIMSKLHEHNARNVLIHGDCKWVINKLQQKRSKRIKLISPEMKDMHMQALELLRGFAYQRLTYVPREYNTRAHDLCRLASRGDTYGGSDIDNRPTTIGFVAN